MLTITLLVMLRSDLSRTTGLPKGVELSHFNLISNVEQIIFKRSQVGSTSFARDRASRLSESGERWLAALPIYHAFVSSQSYSWISSRH